jgi:membrane fusion protein (multidrug efflux system)
VRGADLSAQAAGEVDKIEVRFRQRGAGGKAAAAARPNDDFAKLQQLQAAAELAAQTLKRDQEQFAAQAISQANLDTDVSTLKSARAQVAAQQALIEEKIVKAPFAGRLGIRQVDVGQYLTAGTTVVTLQALDPILIDFYVPQQALGLKIARTGPRTVDTYPGVSFKGTVESINSKVDPRAATCRCAPPFTMPISGWCPACSRPCDRFGRATSEITLPQTAITYNPYGDTVYVVQQRRRRRRQAAGHGAAALRQARCDARRSSGGRERRQAGDVVVSAGQMKLRNGTAVVINNSVQPTDDPNPTPPNE